MSSGVSTWLTPFVVQVGQGFGGSPKWAWIFALDLCNFLNAVPCAHPSRSLKARAVTHFGATVTPLPHIECARGCDARRTPNLAKARRAPCVFRALAMLRNTATPSDTTPSAEPAMTGDRV
jgi:hypothetical protein